MADFNFKSIQAKARKRKENRTGNKTTKEVIVVLRNGAPVQVKNATGKGVLFAAYSVDLDGTVTKLPIHESQFLAVDAKNVTEVVGLGAKIKGYTWQILPGLCFTADELKGATASNVSVTETENIVDKLLAEVKNDVEVEVDEDEDEE